MAARKRIAHLVVMPTGLKLQKTARLAKKILSSCKITVKMRQRPMRVARPTRLTAAHMQIPGRIWRKFRGS